MAGTTVTTKAKKKMLQARAGIAPLSKIVGMAFGTGGVNTSDVIVPHSPDQNALHSEVLRKEVDGYEVVSDTCIRYKCTLTESELANTYISEIGLYDADGDMVAMKAYEERQGFGYGSCIRVRRYFLTYFDILQLVKHKK